jgi:hypothetical protein
LIPGSDQAKKKSIRFNKLVIRTEKLEILSGGKYGQQSNGYTGVGLYTYSISKHGSS